MAASAVSKVNVDLFREEAVNEKEGQTFQLLSRSGGWAVAI
jgi:hypothetical protein